MYEFLIFRQIGEICSNCVGIWKNSEPVYPLLLHHGQKISFAMKNYRLKTGKVEEKVVNAYKKIEDGQ